MKQGIKIKDVKNLPKYKQAFENETQSSLIIGETTVFNSTGINIATLLDFINWLINDVIEKHLVGKENKKG